jgi:hypothetical protein
MHWFVCFLTPVLPRNISRRWPSGICLGSYVSESEPGRALEEIMRKVIQICVEPSTEDDYGALYALCEDGSIWRKYKIGHPTGEESWCPIEDVPEPTFGNL